MINPFLAKTKPVQTIVQHTEDLYQEFMRLRSTYPNIEHLDWTILEIACLYHDLGKMNAKMQNKLLNRLKEQKKLYDDLPEQLEDKLPEIEEIPHGYLSPAFLPKEDLKKIYNDDELRILYQSIYFHHSRKKLDNHEDVKRVIKEELTQYINEFKYSRINDLEKLYPSYTKYINRRIPDEDDTEEIFYQYVMTKGLLNKIDYAASGGIKIEEKNEDLFEKTLDYLRSGGFKPNELQEYMINNQDKNNVIIASTGIGKTEAALFWIGNNKGFFTLPLRVSINAIYDRVISKIKFNKEKTGLLHSETSSEYLKRNNYELDIEYFDKTKQLSLPLTVCTLDQLVDFIFKYEGFELKLATLGYSKLIIDEIQMYSPELVAFLIVALKYITKAGGKFSIVTATLPPIFIDFMNRLNIEFVKPEPFLKKINGKVQLRHKIKILEEDINISHIIKNYKGKKVLVIVNTVKQAQRLYDDLKNEFKNNNENVKINLFHSRFIKKDRTKKEAEILNMGQLNNNDSGIWITTQVVEASLDIDFDVLYTELSDISGLLQRMGRVYRNRDLKVDDINKKEDYTNIYVYLGKENLPSGVGYGDNSIIDKDIFDYSKAAIINYDGEKLDEEKKMELVENVYSIKNLEGKDYYNKIWETIKYVIDIKEYEFEKKEINLRQIDNETIIPKGVYDENKDLITKNITIINESENYNQKLIANNEIKELTMSIPGYQFKEAHKKGYVENMIKVDKYNQIPIVNYDYSAEKGLIKPKMVKGFDKEQQFL